jgi:hypothetical protein
LQQRRRSDELLAGYPGTKRPGQHPGNVSSIFAPTTNTDFQRPAKQSRNSRAYFDERAAAPMPQTKPRRKPLVRHLFRLTGPQVLWNTYANRMRPRVERRTRQLRVNRARKEDEVVVGRVDTKFSANLPRFPTKTTFSHV